jgi:2'-5' RNA ligase
MAQHVLADTLSAMSRPNWFVGVPVPGAALVSRVPEAPRGIRTFHQEDLHLTVAFLGACGEERARAAFAALAWPLPAIDVTFGEVVAMGNPRRYSALSALLVTGRAEVEAAIGASRDAACEVAQVAIDERPPKAHVTIARPARSASDGDRRAALRWAHGIRLEGITVRLDQVALYTWSEDRLSRLFRVVESRPFPPP